MPVTGLSLYRDTWKTSTPFLGTAFVTLLFKPFVSSCILYQGEGCMQQRSPTALSRQAEAGLIINAKHVIESSVQV